MKNGKKTASTASHSSSKSAKTAGSSHSQKNVKGYTPSGSSTGHNPPNTGTSVKNIKK